MTETSADELLLSAYRDLGFLDGALFDAMDAPDERTSSSWVDIGQWLSLAHQVGVDRVFFVDNNPVIVFARHNARDPDSRREVFNRIWCMSRPQLLYLAMPGELVLYMLGQSAVRDGRELLTEERLLEAVDSVAQVQAKLQKYGRLQVESGRLFEDARFGDSTHRADKLLIRDLRTVRSELHLAALPIPHAHSLIGRAIFVRYLEDRKILTRDYFDEVAGDNARWRDILDRRPGKQDVNPDMDKLLFPRVLSDKDFTYALFRRLADDFNGDMFPQDPNEEQAVQPVHLDMLQGFLRGDPGGPQRTLFFFAYRFDIIPIELISSIYEEFYNTETGDEANLGAHYTPSALVEFMLNRTLTPDVLQRNPRIIDPACGSGIFLVEAFRRIVRYRVSKLKRRLNFQELRKILREQIAGIEINGEATRIAAFSLYLAFLHYRVPPDILANKALPNLIFKKREERDPARHFDILVTANSFRVGDHVEDAGVVARFTAECADIVVGNPPWGYPTTEDQAAEAEKAIRWCEACGKSVGDKELSQAFIHLALSLLKPGGIASLLVSTGVFFKEHNKSKAFRAEWLRAARLIHVVNFAHVRNVFFSDGGRTTRAIAPFASVVFERSSDPIFAEHFEYWSAKRTAFVERVQIVVLSSADLRILRQDQVRSDDRLWKIYWWGSNHDEALIRSLAANPTLLTATVDSEPIVAANGLGRGFEDVARAQGRQPPSEEMAKFQEMPSNAIVRYGPLDERKLRALPSLLYREGNLLVYEGVRVLVRRGISQRGGNKGVIISRLETSSAFAIRNSVHGIRLRGTGADAEWVGKVLAGILWSSLTRYYFFLTAGAWGMWHYEIHRGELGALPIRMPADSTMRTRVVRAVDALRTHNDRSRTAALEDDLDEAIYDLYDLTEAERNLVRDMCKVGLELFYGGAASTALKRVDHERPRASSGLLADLPEDRREQAGLEGYLATFLRVWNRELDAGEEFKWHVLRPPSQPLLAVRFTAPFAGASLKDEPDELAWTKAMASLAKHSRVYYGGKIVQAESVYRIVTDTHFLIIKQNEQRLWTRSAALQDAEAVMVDIMQRQELQS